jgi:hypothetical protein
MSTKKTADTLLTEATETPSLDDLMERLPFFTQAPADLDSFKRMMSAFRQERQWWKARP